MFWFILIIGVFDAKQATFRPHLLSLVPDVKTPNLRIESKAKEIPRLDQVASFPTSVKKILRK